jgi:hypothetical protein
MPTKTQHNTMSALVDKPKESGKEEQAQAEGWREMMSEHLFYLTTHDYGGNTKCATDVCNSCIRSGCVGAWGLSV